MHEVSFTYLHKQGYLNILRNTIQRAASVYLQEHTQCLNCFTSTELAEFFLRDCEENGLPKPYTDKRFFFAICEEGPRYCLPVHNAYQKFYEAYLTPVAQLRQVVIREKKKQLHRYCPYARCK